jgi:DNA-binding transcriptional MerR regulator
VITERTFKLTEITRIFGVKQHFIIHLVETGIIKPLEDVKGRGKSRIYSYTNLVEIGVFTYLNQLHISYDKAKNILGLMHEYLEVSPQNIHYVSVIGFLSRKPETEIYVTLNPKKLSAGEYLTQSIARLNKSTFITESDFVYYFVIDVRNIINSINVSIEIL